MKKLITFILIFISFSLHAQESIRVIVPNGAGSMSDTSFRVIAPLLEKELQTDLPVMNIAGANGLLGQLRVAEAKTTEILIGNSTIAFNQLTNKVSRTNILEELEPLYGLVEGTTVVYVSSESKIYSLADLKKFQSENGRLLAGSTNRTGEIALNHLSRVVDAPIEVIQYKLQTDMVMNCVSNLIHVFFGPDGNSVYRSFVESGKIRAIAVISAKRSPAFPGVKTIKEQGYEIIPTFNWTAFFVKKDTPAQTKVALTNAIKKSIMSKDMEDWSNQPGNFRLFKLEGNEIRSLQQKELKYFESQQ